MAHSRARVLFVIPSLGGGGAERVMVSLARRLDRSRFEPHLAALEAAGPCLGDVPPDVPLHDLHTRRVRRALLAMARLVRSLRPQVVLSTLGELNLMVILSRALWPRSVRILVRESTLVSARLARDVRSPRFMAGLIRWLYPRADGIICPSEAILLDLAEGFKVPRHKMVRIYNPLDVDRLRELADAGPRPYSGPGPHLVSAGRLSPVKGYELLIEAMAEVVKTLPSADLTILGEGPEEGKLRALVARLGLAGRVRFAAFQPNPYPWLKHADLFVLSSRYEGLPNAMLEALALGTPAVARDCPGGVREILAGCPVGRLVLGDGAGALAADILDALRAGLQGCEPGDLARFLDRFRPEAVVSQYESLLLARDAHDGN